MADRHPHGTTWHAYEESSAPMTGAAANQTRAARSNGNDARSRSGVSKGGHEPARNCRYPPVVNSRFDNNNAIASSLNSEQQQVVHHRAREARNEFQVLDTGLGSLSFTRSYEDSVSSGPFHPPEDQEEKVVEGRAARAGRDAL